ncbi:hypothetical protein BHM03_00051672 [Ensete ventricosum]|nr:hypothetical protein BHM03_00051672 [Ensete ventricosum]
MMRLNRVELFCMFLLHFRSKRSEEGRSATTRPPVRVAGHGQATCRSCKLRPGPPARAIARGQPAIAPAGAAPTEVPPSGIAPARKGGTYGHSARRSYHPLGQRRLLQKRLPMGKATTSGA